MRDKPLDNFNDDENVGNKYELAIAALSSFTEKYVPATENTMTDMSSSKEIQSLIEGHIDYHLSAADISNTLSQMGYTNKVDDGNSMWLVKKVS